MKQIFSSLSVDGILLVDATNAFNELNHQVALHNVEAICPVLASILINNYCQDDFLMLTLTSHKKTSSNYPLHHTWEKATVVRFRG